MFLLHQRAEQRMIKACLCMCAESPDHSLLTYTKSDNNQEMPHLHTADLTKASGN